MTATSPSPLEQVRAASARLSAAAEAAIAGMGSHDLAALAYNLASGESVSFPLISGVWVAGFPGTRLNLIDDAHHCGGCPAGKVCDTTSRALMETSGPVGLPAHYHDFNETIHIIQGSLQDLLDPVDSLRCRATDILYLPAGKIHELRCEGLFLLCWTPPLQRTPLAL